ncbi:MAG: DUF2934 domain-containing protein [Polyangiaceae bacterium]|jgi:hypothetical protein|nr:DUF2934 domain-containing protein [Polyangiaceae bacterium]
MNRRDRKKKTSSLASLLVKPEPVALLPQFRGLLAPVERKVSPARVEPPAETPRVTPEERRRQIAQRAYQRALAQGLGATDPFHDWLQAEREVDALLTPNATMPCP